MSIGNAACSIGPLYVWGNVVDCVQRDRDAVGANFLKMGFADGERWITGHQYIFHNTIFHHERWDPRGGLGGNRIVKHVVSRNNILQVRSPRDFSASANARNIDNDFDYDLYNGRVPENQEMHGVRGQPKYVSGAGFDSATSTGRFALAPDSPGVGAAVPIPNFTDGTRGRVRTSAPTNAARHRSDSA